MASSGRSRLFLGRSRLSSPPNTLSLSASQLAGTSPSASPTASPSSSQSSLSPPASPSFHLSSSSPVQLESSPEPESRSRAGSKRSISSSHLSVTASSSTPLSSSPSLSDPSLSCSSSSSSSSDQLTQAGPPSPSSSSDQLTEAGPPSPSSKLLIDICYFGLDVTKKLSVEPGWTVDTVSVLATKKLVGAGMSTHALPAFSLFLPNSNEPLAKDLTVASLGVQSGGVLVIKPAAASLALPSSYRALDQRGSRPRQLDRTRSTLYQEDLQEHELSRHLRTLHGRLGDNAAGSKQISFATIRLQQTDVEQIGHLVLTYPAATELDLSGCFGDHGDTLKALVETLHRGAPLPLRHVDLSNNTLHALPAHFGDTFARLTRLCLRHNSLTHLPVSFLLLTNLATLDISCNKFSRLLDADLCQVWAGSLRVLHAHRNAIVRLEPYMLLLTQLQTFTIYDNPVKGVPRGLLAHGGVELLHIVKSDTASAGLFRQRNAKSHSTTLSSSVVSVSLSSSSTTVVDDVVAGAMWPFAVDMDSDAYTDNVASPATPVHECPVPWLPAKETNGEEEDGSGGDAAGAADGSAAGGDESVYTSDDACQTPSDHFDRELFWTRADIVKESISRVFSETRQHIEAEHTTAPPFATPLHVRFLVTSDWSISVVVPASTTVSATLREAMAKIAKRQTMKSVLDESLPAGMNLTSSASLAVKLPGRDEYIYDTSVPLYAVAYVRYCHERSLSIEFQLVPRPQSDLYTSDISEMDHISNLLRKLVRDDVGTPTKLLRHRAVRDQTNKTFWVRMDGVDNFESSLADDGGSSLGRSRPHYFAVFGLAYGADYLAPLTLSPPTPLHQPCGEWVTFSPAVKVSSIPIGAILAVSVFLLLDGRAAKTTADWQKLLLRTYRASLKDERPERFYDQLTKKKYVRPLCWCNVPLSTLLGTLVSGPRELVCFPGGPVNPIAPSIANPDRSCPLLRLCFLKWDAPLMFDSTALAVRQSSLVQASLVRSQSREAIVAPAVRPLGRTATASNGSSSSEDPRLAAILATDPLYQLSRDEKTLLWEQRNLLLARHPRALPKLLQSVPWTDADAVAVVYALLSQWPLLEGAEALQLLDSKFPNPVVRKFAVLSLLGFSDQELALFLLQLVQTLKHEQFLSSALGHFLVIRAQRSPVGLGQSLYWAFESEMQDPAVRPRFAAYKKSLLKIDARLRMDLLFQSRLCRVLKEIACNVKAMAVGAGERLEYLREQLAAANALCLTCENGFRLPLDSGSTARQFVVDSCKVMVSATSPLWLTFENQQPFGEPLHVIFKVGDDLRQDVLTLQMLKLMDSLWKEHGLDLHIIPYRVVATGPSIGMIEVVLNAMTTSAIQKEYAGGAMGALLEKTLAAWLRKYNPSDVAYARAVKQFVHSSAGYAVATYILGIGDRHNDNVMLQKSGNLFHIDFGFFLGNFLKFAGLERETTPFVLTPEMVFVMGGTSSDHYALFISLCVQAYNIIRAHGHLLLTLCSLMISTGLAQLSTVDDLKYLRETLRMDLTDEQAAKQFHKLIKKSIGNTRVRLNNFIHSVVN